MGPVGFFSHSFGELGSSWLFPPTSTILAAPKAPQDAGPAALDAGRAAAGGEATKVEGGMHRQRPRGSGAVGLWGLHHGSCDPCSLANSCSLDAGAAGLCLMGMKNGITGEEFETLGWVDTKKLDKSWICMIRLPQPRHWEAEIFQKFGGNMLNASG